MQRLQSKFEAVKREAPKLLGNEGTRFFLESFQKKEWGGVPWAKRKPSKNRNPLLIGKTRMLKNSVVNSLRQASVTRIRWASAVPYAQIHNEGGQIHKKERTATVGFRKKRGTDGYVFASINAKKRKAKFTQDFTFSAHTINMPQRKFMGVNSQFGARLKRKFELLYRYKLK